MTTESAFAGDGPHRLLPGARELAQRVRQAQRATWFPLLVFAAVTFGAGEGLIASAVVVACEVPGEVPGEVAVELVGKVRGSDVDEVKGAVEVAVEVMAPWWVPWGPRSEGCRRPGPPLLLAAVRHDV